MASTSAKGILPYGWIVKTSKKYPDRVYYFNQATGASTWECPELDPPRLKDVEDLESKHTSILNKSLQNGPLPSVESEEVEQSTYSKTTSKEKLLPSSARLSKTVEIINPTYSKTPVKKSELSLPRTLPKTMVQADNLKHSIDPIRKTSLPLPENVSKPVVSRKRKLEDNPTTADTSLNPPTAVVAPVVLGRKDMIPGLSLQQRQSISLAFINKTKRLQRQTLPEFTLDTPSTSRGIKQPLERQASSSSGRSSYNFKSCSPGSGMDKTNKEVSVQPNQFSTSTSVSASSDSGDTDLDMTSEFEEPPSLQFTEFSREASTCMLSEIQNNSAEDIEMLDVSADLTKIDDLAVPTQVADNLCSYYIVVDTNVLIDDLNWIDELKDTPLEGCGPPHLFIPWIVIQELDNLKRSPKTPGTGRGAQQAVRYLNKVLKSKHPRFHGQSPQEAVDCAKIYSECNDDKILECCMSLRLKMPPEKVILLTNDKNFINKALICDIVVHDRESFMKALKPDVKIGKKSKRKKKKANKSYLKTPETLTKIEQMQLEQKLVKEKDVCKMEIHTIMSQARQLLKVVLQSFLTEEMNEAYGDPWKVFPINLELLKGILDAISKYWRSVFAFHFLEKDKRNFELLREKASRSEGFLGDREDCLSTLTAIEDIFCRIKRRWPQLKVPIEIVQDLRLKCNTIFTKHNSINITISQVESAINSSESDSVLQAFENGWTIINHLCGMVMDFYQIQHNFVYEKPDSVPSEEEFRRLMLNLYPCVLNIKKLMLGVVGAIKNHNPRSEIFEDLYKALRELVPALQIKADNPSLPDFTAKSLERFCRNPENAERVRLGCKQIENYHSKLDQALKVMSSINK